MKKITKNTETVTANVACCTRRQKVWGVVALVGLFACGWMVCASVRGISGNNAMAEPANGTNISECEIIEYHLKRDLDATAKEKDKIEVYKKLVEYGCPENVAEYQANLKGLQIVFGDGMAQKLKQKSTCVKIEDEYKLRLHDVSGAGNDSYKYIDNAKIYAIMAERGCPVNHDKYVALAKQSLELARAISDDEWRAGEYETIEAVETYKRLDMQAAAEEIIDKVKKLSDPAIDFIIQLEKIINE